MKKATAKASVSVAASTGTATKAKAKGKAAASASEGEAAVLEPRMGMPITFGGFPTPLGGFGGVSMAGPGQGQAGFPVYPGMIHVPGSEGSEALWRAMGPFGAMGMGGYPGGPGGYPGGYPGGPGGYPGAMMGGMPGAYGAMGGYGGYGAWGGHFAQQGAIGKTGSEAMWKQYGPFMGAGGAPGAGPMYPGAMFPNGMPPMGGADPRNPWAGAGYNPYGGGMGGGSPYGYGGYYPPAGAGPYGPGAVPAGMMGMSHGGAMAPTYFGPGAYFPGHGMQPGNRHPTAPGAGFAGPAPGGAYGAFNPFMAQQQQMMMMQGGGYPGAPFMQQGNQYAVSHMLASPNVQGAARHPTGFGMHPLQHMAPGTQPDMPYAAPADDAGTPVNYYTTTETYPGTGMGQTLPGAGHGAKAGKASFLEMKESAYRRNRRASLIPTDASFLEVEPTEAQLFPGAAQAAAAGGAAAGPALGPKLAEGDTDYLGMKPVTKAADGMAPGAFEFDQVAHMKGLGGGAKVAKAVDTNMPGELFPGAIATVDKGSKMSIEKMSGKDFIKGIDLTPHTSKPGKNDLVFRAL